MEVRHVPGAYARHGTGRDPTSSSRPTGSRGHVSSRSGSSADDLLGPLSRPSRRDGETTVQTSSLLDTIESPCNKVQDLGWKLVPRRIRHITLRKFIIICLSIVLICTIWLLNKDSEKPFGQGGGVVDAYTPPMPAGYTMSGENGRPIEWLRKNTFLDLSELPAHQVQELTETRPRAAFISLVRNEEVEDMVSSVRQIEARFNGRETHRYDWVFFNNEEFTDEFKTAVSNATGSHCYFERIPEEHWSIPPWIDVTRFDVGRQFMGGIGVGKAWLQSYHHMCRWNAGIFALEDRLAGYDWFWRVEPAVHFYCDINYDVFRFMQDNNMAYGFNMAILDDARSFPSLWERTKTFIDRNKDLIDKEADFNWLLHTAEDHDDTIRPNTGGEEALSDGEYNNCQFYSNFEIGSLEFFRSREHRAYFDHLDRSGGFYYERFGDAPVHTLSVSMFLPKSRIWYFRDIGYAHGLCEQCPPHERQLKHAWSPNGPLPRNAERGKVDEFDEDNLRTLIGGQLESFSSKHRRWDMMAQDVVRQKGIPGLACGCTVSAIDSDNAKLVPYESKQRKPSDPCIRKFLGGRWLVRKNKMSDLISVTENLASSDSIEYVLDGRDGNPFQ